MADFVPQITVQTLMNTAFISLGFLQGVIALIHKICNVRVQPRNRKPLTRLVLLGAWDSATSENSLLVIDIFMVVYSHMPRYLAEFRYKGISIVDTSEIESFLVELDNDRSSLRSKLKNDRSNQDL